MRKVEMIVLDDEWKSLRENVLQTVIKKLIIHSSSTYSVEVPGGLPDVHRTDRESTF